MKYKIIPPESDSHFVVENPRKKDLNFWENEGCLIIEIEELKDSSLHSLAKEEKQ